MNASIRLAPDTVFANDYKIIRPLRTGGQGSLYVVEQLSTSKQRALKLMLPELVAQPTSRKRFELEAKIAARIQSDHVVETIASGVDTKTGVPWLVMELLEGEDLGALLQKRRHLPASEVLEIFGQLCHALGEAHKQGVVHRDLKPENIFLSASRRRGMPFMVKVLDFGIARVMAEAGTQSGATVTGLGTPMWMAPEQTMPGGRIEPMTDVWPLGLLAFRMLTGYLFWKAPYDPGASVMMLMAEAFMHPMPTASGRAAEYKCAERVPPGFDAWMAKCVARNMDERWADASAAFAELEPILASVASGTDAAPVSLARASMPEPRASRPEANTGPGRKTWDGAPELSASAVISAGDSQPIARESASRTSSKTSSTTGASIPAETTKPNRTAIVVVLACIAGVIIGLLLFSSRRSLRSIAQPSPSASFAPIASASGATTAPVAPVVAPSAPEPSEPDASAPPSASAATSSSAAAPAVSGPLKKLCKPAGLKCFSNDDCCDRVCRRWVCRANEALQDPYGGK